MKFNQKATVLRTGSQELDGKIVTVKGIANTLPQTKQQDSNCYIVQFDCTLSNGYDCITLTAHCLEAI
jgi:hypothetical protein